MHVGFYLAAAGMCLLAFFIANACMLTMIGTTLQQLKETLDRQKREALLETLGEPYHDTSVVPNPKARVPTPPKSAPVVWHDPWTTDQLCYARAV